MPEMLNIASTTDREVRYDALLPQAAALVAEGPDMVGAMANLAAAIHDTFAFLWVGFYRVVGNELHLGPFQGPIACTRIAYGKGVCGSAWKEGRTLVVPDVDAFPGHIACSSEARSEIVVPVRDRSGNLVAVLDVDSTEKGGLDERDARGLERVAQLLDRWA
ncbi:MAG: GAF domain-containing protein [Flavobacteriales bacterium]|nr:GAF domain-containing protein [Flavobacteriales bacterium]